MDGQLMRALCSILLCLTLAIPPAIAAPRAVPQILNGISGACNFGYAMAGGIYDSDASFTGWTATRSTLSVKAINAPSCEKTAATITEDSTSSSTHFISVGETHTWTAQAVKMTFWT